jgi:pyruvate/2-oxoglutarate dehydrogenase complex dihydrolipoamide acyltransferase (E2) component
MAVRPVIMPKLGAYTEDILLTEWLVEEGAEISAGTVVLEMETDKTTADVEAEASGWLHRLVQAGEKVPIGTSVGLIAETREEYEALATGSMSDRQSAATGDSTGEANPFLGYIGLGAGAAVVETVAGRASPTEASTGDDGSPLVSPRARALLKELGLPLEASREITGSGPNGRITDRDVSAWARSQEAAPSTSGSGSSELTVAERIPLTGRRGTIATRMVASLQTAAQLTSVLEIDAEPLVDLRSRLNDDGARPRIGVTSIVVKLVAAALGEHPVLNSRVTETDIEVLAEINVAVAVETADGLIAPVVQGADGLSLEEINERIADLAVRARDGELTPADVGGGTFTVSNGGIHPVDITTSILNPPQTGILWVGRIRQRPVVIAGGEIAVRPTLQACLTFDHRAVDGGPAAAFLGTFERLVADLPRLPS